jgi:predicted metal-binding membrane protein
MHLGWMAAIGALILLEKLAPSLKWIPHAIGTVFVIAGGVVMLFPKVLSRLSSYVLL